jgi:hypothetical protein
MGVVVNRKIERSWGADGKTYSHIAEDDTGSIEVAVTTKVPEDHDREGVAEVAEAIAGVLWEELGGDRDEEPEQEPEPDELDAAYAEIDRLRAELEVSDRDLALANATIDDLTAARRPERERNKAAFPVRLGCDVGGLTKYQHTVIEMAKAVVAGGNASPRMTARGAVFMADSIWDVLEGEDNDG